MVKSLFKKIFIVGFIVIIISVIVSSLLPYYYGEKNEYIKYNYYKQNKEKYNALYFGGSLEYRHLIPSIIDKQLSSENIQLQSFNAALDGHTIMQASNELNNYLKLDNKNLKYIFVSVSSDPIFYSQNRHNAAWLTWINGKSVWQSLKILATSPYDLKYKLRFMSYYVSSFFENKLNIGLLSEAFNFYASKNKISDAYLGKNKDGYFSYEEEKEYILNVTKNLKDTVLLGSKYEYDNNDAHRKELLDSAKAQYNRYKTTDKPNQAMVTFLKNIDDICAKKGIQVYYILPPRTRSSYSYLLPIFNSLPENRKIDLANPNEYPAFWEKKYGYNFHHLNEKGAIAFSKEFAKKFGVLYNINNPKKEY